MEVGAQIDEFDQLVEVQSDKATVPITSRYAGKVVKLHYDLEDVAQVGEPLVDIEIDGDEVNDEVDNYEDKIPEETPAQGNHKYLGYDRGPFGQKSQGFFIF